MNKVQDLINFAADQGGLSPDCWRRLGHLGLLIFRRTDFLFGCFARDLAQVSVHIIAILS